MKKFYQVLCCLFLLLLLIPGGISLFDRDPVVSEEAPEQLTSAPEFSLSAFLKGSFFGELVAYYSDSFPGRTALLEADGIVSTFFDFSDLKLEDTE